MSVRRKLTIEEAVAKLRAQEPCRIELDYRTVVDFKTGELRPVVCAAVRFYNENDRVSNQPDFTLYSNTEKPDQDESFSSLLRSLSRIMDAHDVSLPTDVA